MTQPGGGHGNDINLAALWVPVMPETSRMGEEMRKAGTDAKRQFEQGFNTGQSPESMGQSFASKFTSSLGREFSNFELPFGGSRWLDRMGEDVDRKLISKLKGQAADALKEYRSEYENLAAAQGRAAEAESRLTVARENGINKASIMLPLLQEHQAAQKNLTETQNNATAALDTYTKKSGELHEAQGAAADSGKMLAGVLGGLVVAGANLAVQGVEGLVEAVAEGFKEAIDITKELAVKTVELGETYEHIGIQIHEFSAATGEDFESMESAARRVFSTLDVAGNDTGKTMAQLSSMLDVSGESITNLVHDVVELQGRFTNLKAADLGSIFVAFKTPADQFNSTLASMLESARGAGQGLGDLTTALSGNVAITLAEANLNLEQAAAFTAELMKMGAPGRQAMTGMSMAMKEFGKDGLSFADGMRLAGERLQELGNTAEGQDLAEKLFGGRNWAVATQAVQDYLDVVERGPDAFHANADATHRFLDETETLGNKVETFKHKVEDAFRPLGEAAKDFVVTGLSSVSTWFTEHRQEIFTDIQRWGNEFIDALPKIQTFAADSIELLGAFATGALELFQPVAQTLAVAGAGFLALSGHFKDAKDLLVSVNNFDPGKIKDVTDQLAEKIRGYKIDSEAIHEHWNDIADRMQEIPPSAGSSIAQQGSAFNSTPSGIGPGAGGGPILAGPGAGGGGAGGGGFIGPGAGGGNDRLAANKALAQQLFPWPASEWPAFEQLEMHEAGFDSTAKNPSSGAFGMGQFLGHEHDQYASGYSTDPATQLQTMFKYIADRYGTPSAAWAQYYSHPGGQGYYQGGGFIVPEAEIPRNPRDTRSGWGPRDPFGRNPTHSNIPGKGITSGPSWGIGGSHGRDDIHFPWEPWFPLDPWRINRQNLHMLGFQSGGAILGNVSPHVPGHGGLGSDPGSACPEEPCIPPWELAPGSGPPPWGQRIPGLPYPGDPGWAPGKHYAMGGPSGTDTVPAWLTPGEYVWDTKTVDKFGWLISLLHGKAFQGGGPVDDSAAHVDPQLQFIAQIASGFGLTLGSGFRDPNGPAIAGVSANASYHGTGEAQDFGTKGQEDQMLAFASYMFEHFGSQLAELIHDDPRWTHNVNNGRDVGPMGQFYTTAQAGDHTDHVHVAIKSTQSISDQLSPGNEPLSQGIPGLGGVGGPGSIPGGTRGYAFPGIPGQYGGGGAYGGQTADEAASTAKAVQEAKDRASDLDHQIGQQQQRIKDLQDQIAKAGVSDKISPLTKQPYPLTPDEQRAADEKRKGLQQQLDEATHQLTVSQRERAEQDGNIADATRKQTESFYKKPGGQTGAGTAKAVGASEFSQLGSSLLGGIGQELGFGDLFAKPPWEWGAVKLLTGAASWALGTANAWADEIGKGHTGVTGFQPIEGWDQQGGGAGSLLSGLSGSFGINLPKAAIPQSVSSGPNVVPQQPPGPFGPPTGPAPGPVIQGDFMPINVQAGVDPGQILQPVQEQQNANNASLHTFTGGLPQ